MLIEMLRNKEPNVLTISGKQSDGSAFGTGTTGTTNAVDVVLRVVGVVVVQHMRDVADVFVEVSMTLGWG